MQCNTDVMREVLEDMTLVELMRFMINVGLSHYPWCNDPYSQQRDAINFTIEYLSNYTKYGFTVPYQWSYQDTDTYYYDPLEDHFLIMCNSD